MNIKWNRWPEEEPDNEHGVYVIALVDNDGKKPTFQLCFATWIFHISANGDVTVEWFQGGGEPLPDSFYWIELPDVTELAKG